MRIRKNASLSSLMLSHASGTEALQTHVCQLNQSPWDVIPFPQDTYPSLLHQFEGEDSFNGNGSLGDSIGAVESSSVASLMEEDAEDKQAAIKIRVDNMVIDDNYEMEGLNHDKKRVVIHDYQDMKIGKEFKSKKGEKIQCFNNRDNKGWQCKNEAKETQFDNNNNVGLLSTKKPEKGLRRGRAKGAKKGSSSSSNPYEFYYYSGFGPLWGKRRGGDKGEGNRSCSGTSKEAEINNGIINTTSQNTTPCSPIFDYVDEVDDYDDEDDDSENGDGGKKRMRKPVKARSLKSLM